MDRNSFEALKERYERILKSQYIRTKHPERYKEFLSGSGRKVRRVYTPEDCTEIDEISDIGLPGIYPFTRGIRATMYRGRLWTMRQYAGFGNAEESNRRYKYLLQQGQTGLSVAFDLPTQIGYDSDNSMSEGEIGKVGVAIDTLADMETLFDGIPLDRVSTSMTINATACIILAMYIVVAEKQGVPSDKIKGTIQNDILKEYIARGTYIFPPRPSMRIITDIFAYCSKKLTQWNVISISGYHIREAGSTAVQEIAFTLADGIAYVKAALDAGLDIDEFAPRLSFFFNAHNDLLEEVAKFRAVRKLWAEIMKERFGAKNPKSMMLRFHTQTAGSSLTAQQPDNNIVRVTIQVLAAVLGGTQSLHTNSRDEALALPSEESARIALRTQQIVAYESGIANTIDPLAGSYYIESLTNQLANEAKEYIEKIENLGGMVKAIEQGYVQKEIQNSAYQYQKAIENKERIIVGVNKYATEEDKEQELLKVDPIIGEIQKEKLRKIRKKRNNQAVNQSLHRIEEVAKSKENLMPAIISAVREYATLGEIADVMRKVFGIYEENVVL